MYKTLVLELLDQIKIFYFKVSYIHLYPKDSKFKILYDGNIGDLKTEIKQWLLEHYSYLFMSGSSKRISADVLCEKKTYNNNKFHYPNSDDNVIILIKDIDQNIFPLAHYEYINITYHKRVRTTNLLSLRCKKIYEKNMNLPPLNTKEDRNKYIKNYCSEVLREYGF